jgi:2-polyprenyl-6-hydroxyphenyl methylase / 3-demethylubiquinone-9 3-methyltransferase
LAATALKDLENMVELGQGPRRAIPKSRSVDADEVAQFDRLGAEWWRPDGPMRALHKFNPARVAYLRSQLTRQLLADGAPADPQKPLAGLWLLDIGCGGGILSEALAALGADVTAIDPAPRNIEIARSHAEASGLAIDYRCISVEELAAGDKKFDAVLAMEVIEHVRDLRGFVKAAASPVRPGGLFFAATLNRTLKSYALAIVGAEYVLRWVARGTHDWQKFVTPAELSEAMRRGGLEPFDKTGVVYDLLSGRWKLGSDMDVNYMLAARR